jgi:nucleoid-associated protein YgaU
LVWQLRVQKAIKANELGDIKMNKRHSLIITVLILLIFTFAAFAQQYSYDYKNMKMDEYKAELSKWQEREANGKAAIAEQETRCAQTQEQITAAEKEYEDAWNDIYATLETDKAGYDDFTAQCKALENDVAAFAALSAEDIYSRRDELDGYKNRLAELRSDKRSLGPDPYEILQRVENLINQAEEKAKPAAAGKYEVVRGDYLWRIAKKPDIYSDPYAWIRIYTYNRSQISNPDLIYPKQVFDIPRIAGPGEHWVVRGENLTDIASKYESSFTWQKFYEANKEAIGDDANLIYPHMVLKVPGN